MHAPSAQKPTHRRRRWALAALILAVVAGAGLRLIWGMDIEYKGDEEWMFERMQALGTEPFPWIGMPSCAEFNNPGLNTWVFIALGKLTGATDPPGLARGVQALSIAALVLLAVFAWRMVPAHEREPWLWAVALLALNPLAVLFHRKIWQPSLFPLFTLLVLVGWWRRDRRWGAFVWGLVGACLGQIQMAGFFFAAGFTLWALLFDRRGVRWRSWFCGSVVGAVPMLPWLHYLLTRPSGPPKDSNLLHWFEAKFWLRWMTEPFGISVEYALGGDFRDFLRYPLVGGAPTYLVLALHVAIGALALLVLARWAGSLWRERGRLREWFVGKHSPTAFTQSAALWGFGLLMTASTMPVNRHYLLVAMPLQFVWLARIALGRADDGPAKLRFGRAVLALLCIMQGLVTAQFLGYVHGNQRTIAGDYGRPYGAQVQDERQVGR